jgi:hypothetical protein
VFGIENAYPFLPMNILKGDYKVYTLYLPIDLILIDQQSVGKRNLHLMGMSMRKRDGRPITGVSTIVEKEPRSDPLC